MARGVLLGVVLDGAKHDEDLATRDSHSAWFIESDHGSLCGNGKECDGSAGEIAAGGVLTAELDARSGSLRFWLDGKPHGPGFETGVVGDLRWAMSAGYDGTSVQIVPTPTLEAWVPWHEAGDEDEDSEDGSLSDS